MGYVVVHAGGHTEKVDGGHALALRGDGGRMTFGALPPSHFVILSGAEIREPVAGRGPFIMYEASQVEEAGIRYHM
jgi:redox-sensitive bicupin YhaK (pirin superfamily)